MTNSIQVLLVEDDAVDRIVVRRCLRESGLEVELVEAEDGAAALAACAARRFDCVFLDYRLPDSDGATIFKAMLDDYDSTAAVIFLTGQDDENLAMEMMKAGAVDYLTKAEVSTPILKRAVRYAIARQDFLKQLAELARVDALTGLPNRSVFEGLVTKAVAQAKRSGSMVAVTLLDLDHFKNVNDTMGHPAGDDLLKMAAIRLANVVRETDTVVRLGGDEFVVIAPNLNDEGGAARQAQKLVDAFAAPFETHDQELFVSTSVGIALAPLDGSDAAALLKSADMALYKAKDDGRCRFHFFDEKMNTAAQGQRELEVSIRQALTRQEFELYYQPKVEISSGKVLGSESLIRWNHPERGMVSPVEFIPVAERCQLIVEIGEWVLREACRQNVAWQKAGLPPMNCSVNLSPLQLKNASLIGTIDKALADSGLDPACLEVEVTESAILDNVESIATLLELLRRRGISVSIDDFGTGYSSLSHLKQLPVDKLKIDRSFVANIMTDKDDAEITSAIVSLAGKLGLDVIAEGVEDKGQLDFLKQEGCDQVQGYYFSRPLPADEFFRWYQENQGICASINSNNSIVSNKSRDRNSY